MPGNEKTRESQLALWKTFRSKEHYKQIEFIQEFTKPKFINALCLTTDFEVDCWMRSKQAFGKCRKAYGGLEKAMDAVFSQEDIETSDDRRDAKAEEELNRVWKALARIVLKELGAPLKPEYIPTTFHHVVWAGFVRVYKARNSGEPELHDLAKLMRGGALEGAIQDTIRIMSDVRFITCKLRKEVRNTLKDLQNAKKAGDDFDEQVFMKLCTNETYLVGLLQMLHSAATTLGGTQLLFRQAESAKATANDAALVKEVKGFADALLARNGKPVSLEAALATNETLSGATNVLDATLAAGTKEQAPERDDTDYPSYFG